MIWDSEGLFEKSAVYFQRAYEGERESDSFALGVTLGFEFLARSALAGVHPALLADPREGENLMYAFGYPGKKPPKSVPFATVMRRLAVVVDEFTDDDVKFAISVLEMRNAELHSADLPFDTFKPQAWLPRMLRLSQTLCISLGKDLADLLGDEDAAAAAEMIGSLEDKLKKEAFDRVSAAKNPFDELSADEKIAKTTLAKERTHEGLGFGDRVVICPACGADAVMGGKVIRHLEPRAMEDVVEERAVILPTSLRCTACGLELKKHGHLAQLDLGAQYTVTSETDPKDYFGIELEPEDYYEPDYGND